MRLALGSQQVLIYSFSVGRIRGFQIGNLRGRQNAVNSSCFTRQIACVASNC